MGWVVEFDIADGRRGGRGEDVGEQVGCGECSTISEIQTAVWWGQAGSSRAAVPAPPPLAPHEALRGKAASRATGTWAWGARSTPKKGETSASPASRPLLKG